MSRIDPMSETWRTIRAFTDDAIRQAQNELEQPGLDIAGTEHMRGRIAAFRSILGLAAAAPTIPSFDPLD